MGDDVIAIGSDFDGFSDPPDDIVDASKLPRLTRRLWSELGEGGGQKYTPEAIRKFLGGNAIRFILDRWSKTDDAAIGTDRA